MLPTTDQWEQGVTLLGPPFAEPNSRDWVPESRDTVGCAEESDNDEAKLPDSMSLALITLKRNPQPDLECFLMLTSAKTGIKYVSLSFISKKLKLIVV